MWIRNSKAGLRTTLEILVPSRKDERYLLWNNDGILRFNDLCKAVKADRTKYVANDKTILSDMAPEENTQRPSSKKRKKKLPPIAKAYVESDEDGSNSEGEEDNESDENNDDESEE